jgi:hypothetical protein
MPAPVPYANLTNPQTLNLYAMVGDNPETFADLDGHFRLSLNDWFAEITNEADNPPQVAAAQTVNADANQGQNSSSPSGQQAQNPNGWSLSWQVNASANFLVGELKGVADVTITPVVNAVEHPVQTVEV